MQLILHSVTFAALLPFALGGITTPSLNDLRHTNRISQVAGGKKLPGPVAVANVYKKYHKQAPSAVIAAANSAVSAMLIAATTTTTTSTSTAQTAAVTATDLPNDEAYYVNVTVGKTQMLLNFDTGSSDLWVFSTKLPAAQKGSHHLYNLSGTLDAGQTWDISYGDGSGMLYLST